MPMTDGERAFAYSMQQLDKNRAIEDRLQRLEAIVAEWAPLIRQLAPWLEGEKREGR